MEESRAKQLTAALAAGAAELNEIARKAAASKQSITGTGFYAEKFHRCVGTLRT
jgi:hypothetical protein